MFKKIISAVIAITMVMGMCSCSEQSSSDPDHSSSSVIKSEPDPNSSSVIITEPDPDSEPSSGNNNGGSVIQPTADLTFVAASNDQSFDQKFLNGVNNFSVELFKNTVKSDLSSGMNTLVSPESVLFAMGMTENGADANTLKQMQDVLCKGADLDSFNKNMNLMITNAEKSNQEKAKLKIANSVWINMIENMTPNQQFVKNCKQLYNAEMFNDPFNDSTADKINSWVNDKTDKMIPTIVDEIPEDARAVLVNCIAFDAKWADPYEETQVHEDQEFTNAKGDKVSCTMLTGSEKTYVSDEKAQGFIKMYDGGKYAFMAVLPNEGVNLSDYVSSLTADSFSKLYNSKSREYSVLTKLPKFTYDYSIRLNDALAQMGITDAFDPSVADFSKMSNTKLHISSVLHKTHIEVDAEGTKAAAATAVTMETNAAMAEDEFKTVYLDRPFVYAIMDTDTGLPVFMGTVCDPTV